MNIARNIDTFIYHSIYYISSVVYKIAKKENILNSSKISTLIYLKFYKLILDVTN